MQGFLGWPQQCLGLDFRTAGLLAGSVSNTSDEDDSPSGSNP